VRHLRCDLICTRVNGKLRGCQRLEDAEFKQTASVDSPEALNLLPDGKKTKNVITKSEEIKTADQADSCRNSGP
jgi:hypothetical protein